MGVRNTPESDWCDYGHMPESMCEHCQTGEKNAGTPNMLGGRPVAVADSTAIIPATYNGQCAAGDKCVLEGEIRKDDLITHTRKGWAHEGCV